jgi:methionyl-tRNA formyltransferase
MTNDEAVVLTSSFRHSSFGPSPFRLPPSSRTLNPMRLLMLGTGPFAVPTFRALYDTRHSVVALATAPVRTHRGKPVEPISSIRDVAQQHGTLIFDPEDINTPESVARLNGVAANLLVTCDYGQRLSPAALASARQGGVNLHASLLPKYRGAAPINWAIYNGETETGVTVIHMTPQIDAGPCIAQVRVVIDPDETAAELEARLAEIGARLLCQTIDRLEAGDSPILPQDASLASKAPRLKKTDGLIDWTRSATAIKNHIRAMEPWPKTYTYWHRPNSPPVRLILGPVSAVELQPGSDLAPGESPGAKWENVPGTIVEAAGGRLVVAAGQGAVMPANIQPAGKRLLPIDEFLRGYHVRPGERFGPETH